MWDIESGKKTSLLPASLRGGDGNKREILTIATSDDGRYLAVGGRDNRVRIFDIRKTSSSSTSSSYPIVATFEGHKKAVTALAFRPRTLDLYSGSDDRCIRRYDLNSMTYVETLYGHQSPVVDVSCANKNRPVTVARDRTVRVWKVEEDSHLVYRPGGDVGGAECVSSMRDGWFATGHEDGRLALWKEEKKRPVGSVVAAHGRVGSVSGAGGVTRSIMCCDALALSDVLATGSNDGYLRFWRVIADERESGIKPLDAIPIHGFINGIAMGPGGKFCVAAVGQEPRMGRWDRVPRAKNRFAIIRLHGD
jgi:ribosomal RNA-processing protein 9